MAMPQVLKNMNLFVDGRGHAGKVDEVTPPKLALKTEEHRAGGMDAPVDLDMGMEKLMLDYTLSEYDKEVLKLFGIKEGAAVQHTLRGAMEAEDGAVVPVIINVRGMLTEVDMGTWKPGEKSQMKCSMNCRYYKMTIGGEVIHEVDVENMIRIINGTDQLAAHRDALGL